MAAISDANDLSPRGPIEVLGQVLFELSHPDIHVDTLPCECVHVKSTSGHGATPNKLSKFCANCSLAASRVVPQRSAAKAAVCFTLAGSFCASFSGPR